MEIRETFWSMLTLLIKIIVGVFLVANALDFLPKTVKFTEFEVKEPLPLKGKLALNILLNKAERLFENSIKGPEGLAVLDGELYISLMGGVVAKVTPEKVIPIMRSGQLCKYWWDEEICGRPLGLATTENGYLIVADAYNGIFKLNPRNKAYINLVDKNVEIKGIVPKIFNDVTVAKDGTIYWTHSSSDFDLYKGLFTFLADPSGRLMKFDPITKTNEVLLDKLFFANGVALSVDEDFLVVCETGSSRIIKYYLKGSKKAQSEIFIDGLPGLPDGIRRNGKGGFIVSLIGARDFQHPMITDFIAHRPFIRRTFARVLALADWTSRVLHKLLPNRITRRMTYLVAHFETYSFFFPNRSTILEILENGQVNASFHALDGSVTSISDAIVYKGHLYMGSPYNNYLARISLTKLEGRFVNTNERLK